jgi:hypothetical protein
MPLLIPMSGLNWTAGQTVLLLAEVGLLTGLSSSAVAQRDRPNQERWVVADEVGTGVRRFEARAGEGREFTWWLPPQADSYVLPVSAGVRVEANDEVAIRWLREVSPWKLRELPLLGLRSGEKAWW